MSGMGRREFVALLGGAAAAWPLAARAQQAGVMRRIGLLMGFAENSADGQRQPECFAKGVGKAGLGGPWCVIILGLPHQFRELPRLTVDCSSSRFANR